MKVGLQFISNFTNVYSSLFILHKVVLHNNKKQKTNAVIHMLGFALITFLPLTKCRFYLQTLELYIHVDDGFVYKFC